MNVLNKKLWKNFDIITLILLFLLFFVSIAFIAYATASNFTGEEAGFSEIMSKINFHYVRLQTLWFVLGLGLIFIICLIDYHTIADLINIPYVFLIVALVILLAIQEVVAINGTAAWFKIGERSFQPAEFIKIVLVVVVAKYAARAVEKHGNTSMKTPEFWKMMLKVAIPFLLVLIQPDAGTAIVYLVITVGILFASGFPLRTFLLTIPIVIILVIVFYFTIMKDYQKGRIINFFDLWENQKFLDISRISKEKKAELMAEYAANMQATNAATVIRNGGMTGIGFFSPGSLVHLEYLPEASTDFILASGLEATGVVGGLGLLALYAVLLWRCIYLATKAKDKLGTYIIVGVVVMEIYHILVNVGMNIGVMPVMGIPLPFISYGGSNMFTNMIAMGMVFNVAMRRPNKRFEN